MSLRINKKPATFVIEILDNDYDRHEIPILPKKENPASTVAKRERGIKTELEGDSFDVIDDDNPDVYKFQLLYSLDTAKLVFFF